MKAAFAQNYVGQIEVDSRTTSRGRGSDVDLHDAWSTRANGGGAFTTAVHGKSTGSGYSLLRRDRPSLFGAGSKLWRAPVPIIFYVGHRRQIWGAGDIRHGAHTFWLLFLDQSLLPPLPIFGDIGLVGGIADFCRGERVAEIDVGVILDFMGKFLLPGAAHGDR